VYRGISDARGEGSYGVPREAFAHTDPAAIVRLEAWQADGQALPSWLSFEPVSGTFRGTPPAGTSGGIDLILVARDDEGREARVEFRLEMAVRGLSELSDGEAEDFKAKGWVEEEAPAEEPVAADPVEAKDARDRTKVGKEPVKRGAASFAEQIRATRISRDPVLAKILDSGPKPKGGPRA
jgi:hypothetical protein